MTTKERENKRRIWQERVDEYKKSGKSQKVWCKEHNIPVSTSGYWISRLKKESCQEQLLQWLKCEVDEFGTAGIISVPATVVEPADEDIAGEISIEHGDITVRLPVYADSELIARIIALLKAS